MKNFNWKTFTKKIAIKASMQDLYNAWTIPIEIEKWFLCKAVYHNSKGEEIPRNSNIQANDTYQWSWYLYDIVEKGKIIKANGKDLLQFSFAGDCIVEINFKQHQEFVIVELTQSNIPTDDKSKKDIRLGCESGWAFYLVNLKSIFEGGIDLRNKNETLQVMLNN